MVFGMGRRSTPRVGIREVAATAGVSPTTVSHALNGKGRISPETREKILAVARDLDYVPNRNAQNLVRGDQASIALSIAGNVEGVPVFTNWDVEYFMRLVTGAYDEASKSLLKIIFRPFGPDLDPRVFDATEEEEEEEEEVDALMVVDPYPGQDLFLRTNLAVTTGRVPPTEDNPEPDNPYWVDNDNIAATRMLLDHMAEQGARSITLLTPQPFASVIVDCEQAYLEWSRERGVEPRIHHSESSASETAGSDATVELLEDDDPPDAIFATMQGLAVGSLIAAKERGVRVPEELMVAAFCNGLAGANSLGTITAVDLAPEIVGAKAVSILAELLEDREPEEPHVIVPTTLMVRSSTLRKG